MIATVERSWYERLGPEAGRIHIVLIEETMLLGEVIAGPPPRPRRTRREIVLTVESNIPDFTDLVPGELELILPAVTRLLESLADEEAAKG